MKILFLIAYEGYQPIEYSVTRAVVANAGIGVVVASNKKGNALASDGSTTPVEILVDNAKAADYDGIVIVGGPGALECLDTAPVYELIRAFFTAKKMVSAICISSRILVSAGVLVGKKATGWDDDSQLADLFKRHDVIHVKQPVVVDGSIITATGPAAAKAFGEAIVTFMTQKK